MQHASTLYNHQVEFHPLTSLRKTADAMDDRQLPDLGEFLRHCYATRSMANCSHPWQLCRSCFVKSEFSLTFEPFAMIWHNGRPPVRGGLMDRSCR